MIENQIKLPVKIAIQVVMQGIKIRLGRSVVTITGVVLGIAFLMSILAGQVLKSGVLEEDEIRAEVDRRMNFIMNEMGPATGRDLVVSANLPWSEEDTRIIEQLLEDGLSNLTLHGVIPDAARIPAERYTTIQSVDAESGTQASAIYLIGDLDLQSFPIEFFDEARQKVALIAGEIDEIPSNFAKIATVRLTQKPTEEELARIAEEKRKDHFRNSWIIIISLLVTVIGITNAMLMSVTERFRDIGTMKCLGALSGFVRQMFLLESAFMGSVGSAVGCLVGVLFSLVAYGFTYGFGLITVALFSEWEALSGWILVSLAAGIILSILAAIYPASVASRMVPAVALRTSV